MWVREQTFRNKDGSTRTYLHLVESRRVNGKVRQTLIRTLGRRDVLQASGALDKLIASLARHSQRQWVEAEALPLLGSVKPGVRAGIGVLAAVGEAWATPSFPGALSEEPGGIPCGGGPLRDGAESPPRP